MIVLESVPGTGNAKAARQEAQAGEALFSDDLSMPGMTAAPEHEDRPAGSMDTETASDQLHAEAKALGFEWMTYIRLSRVGDRFHIRAFIPTYTPRHWSKHYLEEDCIEVDLRAHIACRQETPLVWDLPLLAEGCGASPVNQRWREFLAIANNSGMRSGITFGIAAPNGNDHAIVDFCSSRAGRAWIADSTVGQCYAAGLKWHSLLADIACHARPASPEVALSGIQRSALELMINGLSSKEIGEALNTSVQNVDYHIRELRRKFGARNRVELAYAAGRLLAG